MNRTDGALLRRVRSFERRRFSPETQISAGGTGEWDVVKLPRPEEYKDVSATP